VNKFQPIFDKQKDYFDTDATKSYEWRIEQLDRMARMLNENNELFQEAVSKISKLRWKRRSLRSQLLWRPLTSRQGRDSRIKQENKRTVKRTNDQRHTVWLPDNLGRVSRGRECLRNHGGHRLHPLL
jgi:hypothetical protein